MPDNEDVAFAVVIPCTEDVESSGNIIDRWKELESRDHNILWFPFIWSETPEFITHVRREGDARQDQARVVVEENDIWVV